MRRDINCPCGISFSIETLDEIDIDKNPECIEEISEGAFMIFTCARCGKIHKPEFPVMLLWKSKNLLLEVLPELDRGGFYRRKKDNPSFETVIGYPELADRVAVIKDGLEPAVIEALKYYLLLKAEETYPDREISAWYGGKNFETIVFHLDGIKKGEVAEMKVPQNVYDKTFGEYRKHPKEGIFASLRRRSYLSVQNMLRPEALQ
ncbi:MAG: CpXC domain-containing protein [Treponema sp.]|jgi:hypothetical protein|nr:CpXC domain-containing protein [Treponema sp.]